MRVHVHPDPRAASAAAAELLEGWLNNPACRRVMLAAGNTPLELYRLIGERKLPLSRLHVYVLDEYVGVPAEDPRNVANIIHSTAIEPWGLPESRYHRIQSSKTEALASVRRHERRIEEAGGLDVIVLGLGQNGHLGFNEPGSEEDSEARVLDLASISVKANREWFDGQHAPDQGATVGLKTILAAERVLILAFGPQKTAAVRAMVEGPRSTDCPASLLQGHPRVHAFIDSEAAKGLS